jgi:hypothetical protein
MIPGPPFGSAGSLNEANRSFRAGWESFKAKHGPEKLAAAYEATNHANWPERYRQGKKSFLLGTRPPSISAVVALCTGSIADVMNLGALPDRSVRAPTAVSMPLRSRPGSTPSALG